MASAPAFADRARDSLARREPAAARRAWRQALAWDPTDAASVYNLGILERRLDDAAAGRQFARSLCLRPGHAASANSLASLLLAKGDGAAAEAVCRRTLTHAPGSAGLHHAAALVAIHRAAGDPAGRAVADDRLRRALSLAPDHAASWLTLGQLRHAAEPESAFRCYGRAAAVAPPASECLANMGAIRHAAGRIGEAAALYEAALRHRPTDADTLANLAAARLDEGELDRAASAADAALAHAPGHRRAAWVRAWIALLSRDFEAGFARFDETWQDPEPGMPAHATRWPLWHGDRPANGRLLLWCEQGIGDELLHAGMLPEVIATGAQPVLEADGRLVPLFARSFPDVEVVARGDALPADIVAQSSTLRLPMLFRDRIELEAGRQPYLRADRDRVATCRDALARLGPRPWIGLSWRSGNPRTGAQKSMRLTDWTPLLDRGMIFPEDVDGADPWQFKNFRVV